MARKRNVQSIFGGPFERSRYYGGVRLDANGNFSRGGSVYHRSSTGEDYFVGSIAKTPSLNRASGRRSGSGGSPT